MSSAAAIPYERQSGANGNRSCGAACLCMVYKSLGQEVPQSAIWPVIAKTNRFGSLASTTHLMAMDALNRGFRAVVMQARHPLQALRLCQEMGTRAILNHRLRADAPTGHYSVLVDIAERDAVLHDPFDGPARRVTHAELLELWHPGAQDSEISGHVLIAIAAAKDPVARTCEFCHVPFPITAACPRCRKPVTLQPDEPLGCANTACIARMWNYICCPFCDQAFTFNVEPTLAGGAQPAPTPSNPQASPPADPLNFDSLFAEMDKFCAHILSEPAAANHPEIKQHLNFVQQQKDKLNLARAEALAQKAAAQTQLSSMEASMKHNQEVHAKRMEELNAQAPPLDGDALGRALLKTAGFLD